MAFKATESSLRTIRVDVVSGKTTLAFAAEDRAIIVLYNLTACSDLLALV